MTSPLLHSRGLSALCLLALALAAPSAWAKKAKDKAPPPAASAPAADAPAAPAATAPATDAPASAPAATTPAPAEAAPAATPAPAPEETIKRAPRNRSLEYAKDLLQQGRAEEALKELETAATLPGNTAETALEIAVVRSEALLLQKKPAEFAARELMVEVLHSDPEGKLYAGAPEKVTSVLESVKAEQVLVLHDRVAVSKPGRPVKLRARIVDPQGKVATVTLHYKGHAVGGWSTEPMKKEPSGWTGFLRDPAVLAPEGVTDGFLVDYYLSAEDAAGKVLDTNGSDDEPISLEISSTRVTDDNVDLSAIELHDKPAAPVEAPAVATVKPWYLRWYTLTAAGVVVVGAAAAIYAATRPAPLDPHIDVLHLP